MYLKAPLLIYKLEIIMKFVYMDIVCSCVVSLLEL
jgi:hypothetical protein